jgi:hypothetical protein
MDNPGYPYPGAGGHVWRTISGTEHSVDVLPGMKSQQVHRPRMMGQQVHRASRCIGPE